MYIKRFSPQLSVFHLRRFSEVCKKTRTFLHDHLVDQLKFRTFVKTK